MSDLRPVSCTAESICPIRQVDLRYIGICSCGTGCRISTASFRYRNHITDYWQPLNVSED